MPRLIRRVVTGFDSDGRSTFIDDKPIAPMGADPGWPTRRVDFVTRHQLFRTDGGKSASGRDPVDHGRSHAAGRGFVHSGALSGLVNTALVGTIARDALSRAG